MLAKAKRNTNARRVVRIHRKTRIRNKLNKARTPLPRLVLYRSNHFLYGQLVDDQSATTMAQANTREKEFANLKSKKDLEAAVALGKLMGTRAKEKKVDKVVFDRNGYNYHGRVKAFADSAREAGLKF